MTEELKKRFFEKTEESGRHIVTSLRTGKQYAIEPIGSTRTAFGDINPVTKKVEGSYGDKYKGSIDESESLITEANGFINITTTDIGVSPYGIIDELDAKYPTLTIVKS